MNGRIEALCSAAKRGPKEAVSELTLLPRLGVAGDVHAKGGLRQVSLLAKERVEEFAKELGREGFPPGAFGENILVSGLDLPRLGLGRRLLAGERAVVQLSQYGKTCHHPCAIARQNGRCMMPDDGVFVRVLRGGVLRLGDTLTDDAALNRTRLAVLTLSDKGARGERKDESGPAACELLSALPNALLVESAMLPDERGDIEEKLKALCDETLCDLIVTTGGTGLSPRDVTPEATMAVCERLVPGLAEAIRQAGLSKTPMAMLSRAVAGQRGHTLILNLSGSPRAVREQLAVVMPVLPHALAVAGGLGQECARV